MRWRKLAQARARLAYDFMRKGAVLKVVSHKEPGRLRRVEGRHNSLVKELRQAFSRGELTSAGECAVEGFHIVEEAVRSGIKIRTVFFSESAESRAHKLLPQIPSQVETLLLPDKLFASAVPSQSPQGVAALVLVKAMSAEDVLESPSSGPVLVIAGVQDPGNLGTILRSAEAFGAKGILLGEGTVSAYNTKVVRASAGSVFRVSLAKTTLAEAVHLLRSRSFRLLATSSHKGVALPEAQLRGAAVLVGNEGAGIDKKLLGLMDELIMIPHSPKVESLNAGVATSIVLYEAARQRD
jgi:TrmH family RNA methyltransferase